MEGLYVGNYEFVVIKYEKDWSNVKIMGIGLVYIGFQQFLGNFLLNNPALNDFLINVSKLEINNIFLSLSYLL